MFNKEEGVLIESLSHLAPQIQVNSIVKLIQYWKYYPTAVKHAPSVMSRCTDQLKKYKPPFEIKKY